MAKLNYSQRDLRDLRPEASNPETPPERLVQLRNIAETCGLDIEAVTLKSILYANPNAPLKLFGRDRDRYRYIDAIAHNTSLPLYVLENPRFIDSLIPRELPRSMQQEMYQKLQDGLDRMTQNSVGKKGHRPRKSRVGSVLEGRDRCDDILARMVTELDILLPIYQNTRSQLEEGIEDEHIMADYKKAKGTAHWKAFFALGAQLFDQELNVRDEDLQTLRDVYHNAFNDLATNPSCHKEIERDSFSDHGSSDSVIDGIWRVKGDLEEILRTEYDEDKLVLMFYPYREIEWPVAGGNLTDLINYLGVRPYKMDAYPSITLIGKSATERILMRYLKTKPSNVGAKEESGLEYLLQKPGTILEIGPETGKLVREGISILRSPRGSWRFLFSEKGKPLSVLQVTDLGHGRAMTENVYTVPSHRHRGLVAKLLAEARLKWKELTHALKDLADHELVGRARRRATKIKEEAPGFIQNLQNLWIRRSWEDDGNPFHLEHIDYILSPKGKVWTIGPETGSFKKNGISLFKSEVKFPTESWRYVFAKNGRIVSALQIYPKNKTLATISTVYTDPDFRRQGLAEKLLKKARTHFKRVEHSSLRSPAGNVWASAVGALPGDLTMSSLPKSKPDFHSIVGGSGLWPIIEAVQANPRFRHKLTEQDSEVAHGLYAKALRFASERGFPLSSIRVVMAARRQGKSIAFPLTVTFLMFNGSEWTAWRGRAPVAVAPFPIYSKWAQAYLEFPEEEIDAKMKKDLSARKVRGKPFYHVSVENWIGDTASREEPEVGSVQIWEGGGLQIMPSVGGKKKNGVKHGQRS